MLSMICHKKTVRNVRAFTLIELLVVILALSAVSLTLYGVLNSGIKIWRVVNQAIPEEEVNIFLEKFTSEVRNSFNFNGIDFLGKTEDLEFATLVASQRLGLRSAGKVKYSYDSIDKVLRKTQYDFASVKGADEPRAQDVLRNVDTLRFMYYVYDKQMKTYEWKDERLGGGLPIAVRVEVEIKYNDKTSSFTKTIGIPVSG